MDASSQLKEVVTFWDIVKWALGLLWAAVTMLAHRMWTQQEGRIAALEGRSALEHKQRVDDLNQHAMLDTNSHDEIRKNLATEIGKLNDKLDDRTDLLVEKIDKHHTTITGRIDTLITALAKGELK